VAADAPADRSAPPPALAPLAYNLAIILAAIVLVIFWLVEAPALVASGDVDRVTVFGSTNDALVALALLLLVPVAIFVDRAGHPGSLHRIAGGVGVAGLVLGGVFQFVNALRLIDYGTNTIIVGVAFVLVGAWLVALSVPAGTGALFSRGARRAGALAGLSFLLIGGFVAIAGPSAVTDPQAMMSSPVLVALIGFGTAGLHLVTPVWAILTGRRWIAATQVSS